MAAQLLFGTAERILNSLTPLVAQEIGLLWGVEDELNRLMNTISTIKAVLLDAEEKRAAGGHAVKNWLEKLQDVIYDAEDFLDDVSTEALRREIMTHDKKAKKVRKFFSESNPLVYRHEMAHKIKAIRERLDAINADRASFHLVVRDAETRVASRETYSFVREKSIIGREDDKKVVTDRLVDSNVGDDVSILPIVAIGGLGKTALAQLIFNDEQIQKHFQLKMWVCVSDPFNVKDIVGKILESATNSKQPDVQMNTLVNYLKNEIDGKKYLLVLDDVWNEDRRKWSKLKEVLMGGARGSRILVTTRTERVATICGTVESYSLRGLKEHASWSLFMQMAFEKGQEPEENSSIAAIGREILKKCSGVPLAIRTIGSLLRFKKSETEWLNFKNDKLSKVPQNETDILPTLKLSYDQLQSHLKHCFAYCSLFPKDFDINRSELIRLWIAQGFVKLSDQSRCLEDVGNEYFMDLLWRSFFQEAETDKFDNVTHCKMHDLMHDLASLEAGSLITTLDDKEMNVDENIRHVSIDCDISTLSITTSLGKASGIRTFLRPTWKHLEFGESFCEAIVSSFKLLRTLDLQGHGGMGFLILPSSIGMLKHLRYLDLSGNFHLKKLPNSITELHNLQTLKLTGCLELSEWPEDMQKLVNLRHLDIHNCNMLTYMPRGLGKLTNLQTLSKFAIHMYPMRMNRYTKYSGGLKELNGLTNLRGKLVIENLRHGKDVASECKAANLKEKKHLHALTLQWWSGEGVNDLDVDVDAELILEDLQPHQNLKELRFVLYDCKSLRLRLPSWLSSLTNLVRFELHANCQYMPPLSQLPSLKYLSLIAEAMEYISVGNEFSSSSSAPTPFFPSLEEIRLIHCCNLKGWWRRHSSVEANSDGDNSVEITTETSMTAHCLLPSFPCLSTLKIEYCPMLTSMPMFPHLERELVLRCTSSKLLQQTMMMNGAAPQSPTPTTIGSSSSTPLSKLKFIVLDSIADLETLPEEWLKNLTSLESLRISRCDRLKSLSPGIQHLTTLQDLNIENCLELELSNDEDGMQWQGLKSLFSLKFSRLPKLVTLPLGLQHVTTLQELTISDCENLTAIPDWIQNCTSLQDFEISDCSCLTSLPEGMRSLKSLRISDCDSLKSLSPGIQHLTTLQDLNIENCLELELSNDEDGMQWQGLKSLFSLKFSRLPKLVTLPLGLQHVTTLQKLKISTCENLTAIPDWIQNCTSLQDFKISDCSSLTSLPEGMRSLKSLQRLKIYSCPVLLQRCKREVGEDWPKISDIPDLVLQEHIEPPHIFD